MRAVLLLIILRVKLDPIRRVRLVLWLCLYLCLAPVNTKMLRNLVKVCLNHSLFHKLQDKRVFSRVEHKLQAKPQQSSIMATSQDLPPSLPAPLHTIQSDSSIDSLLMLDDLLSLDSTP